MSTEMKSTGVGRSGEFRRGELDVMGLGRWYVQRCDEAMGELQYDIAVEVDTSDGPMRVWVPVATTHSVVSVDDAYREAIERAKSLSVTGEVRSVLSQ